jgi:peptide/nickel transport system permease protein
MNPAVPDVPGLAERPIRWRLRRPPVGLVVTGAIVLAYVMVALAAPVLIQYDHSRTDLVNRLRPPGSALTSGGLAPLGTDQVGRDILAQVLYGARISLLVGVATVLVAGVVGVGLGMLAGSSGGWQDSLVMRVADIQLALPPFLLAILIAGVLGASVANVVITLALTRWVIFARVARGSTLTFSRRDYVDSARVLGASQGRLLRYHILPAMRTPLVVLASVQFGLVILSEAALSFLGLGVPLTEPSWGQTIAGGQDYLASAWWISTLPGLVLAFVAVAFGLFGGQLRDALDPHLKLR